MSKQMKAVLDKQLSGIAVHEQLEKRIIALPKARQKARQRSMAAIVACGLLLIALPVLAATSPGFQALLSQVGDKIAGMLQPIELVCESNGIRMEVVAAMNDDSKAAVYITLRDVTGDRLEGNIDLYNYGISRTGMSFTNGAQYDEATRTATLRILAYGGDQLNGRKVTFSLQSFLVGRTEWEDVDLGIPLDTVGVAEHTLWLAKDAWSGGGGNFDEITANGGISILPPGELRIPIPGVDFAYISNIGLIDGRLHVQTCYPEKKFSLVNPESVDGHMDDHGAVWLVDKDGKPISGDGSYVSVHFRVDAQGDLCDAGYSVLDPQDEKVEYHEEVFTVDSDLAQHALRGYFATNKAYITGDWSVTFQLQAVKSFKQAECDIDIGSGRIHTITASPIGWTLLGDRASSDSDVRAEVLVKMTDGAEERFEVRCFPGDETGFEYHSFAEEPLDIRRIKEVYVNGQPVPLVERR